MKILFIGPVGDYSIHDGGYGNASSGMYYILEKMQKEGMIESVELCSTLTGGYIHPKSKDYDLSITMAHPSSFLNQNTRFNFEQIYSICKRNYLSVVWETEPMPTTWNSLWDDNMFTGFLAPSFFIKNQIEKKTEKPIYYYPHFINKDIFPQINIEDKLEEKLFKVLFIGQYTARKGMEDAVVGYSRALGNKSDCKLILKYHAMSNKEIHPEDFVKYLNKCNVKSHTTNTIYALDSFLEADELAKLYRESSLLLMCSRGEGFGITGPEGMLSGIPVMYTNWSSLPEVAEAKGNYPIDYFLDEAVNMAHHNYEKNSKYAKPSISSMMTNLTQAYTFWKDDRKGYYESVEQNRQLIIDKFGEEKIKEYLMDIVEGG